MILKTVLERIDQMMDVPFNLYFTRFIMRVQDDILDQEIESVAHKSSVNADDLQNLIESIHRGL